MSEQVQTCASVKRLLTEYLAGWLSESELLSLESHFGACLDCAQALAIAKGEVMALQRLVSEPPLAAGQKSALFGRIEASTGGASTSDDGVAWLAARIAPLVPQSEARDRALRGPWYPTPVQGVAVKVLAVDPASDRRAVLLLMDPGQVFPAHHHFGEEECLLLSGDLAAGDVPLEVGRRTRTPAGSDHGPQVTVSGCLIVVVGSMRDAG